MIIDFKEILGRLKEKPKSILHCGACQCEELSLYKDNGINNVFWVECNPELYWKLVGKVGYAHSFPLAVSDKEGDVVDFYRIKSLDNTNLGCSSIMKPSRILENPYLRHIDTIKVTTTTIDYINKIFGPFDCLNIDIEGATKRALMGADFALNNSIFSIITEFNIVPDHENGTTLDELDDFLGKYSFKRVITKYVTENLGDSLFVKEKI